MRAWSIILMGVRGVVLAPSRSAARAAAIRAANEAGYEVRFMDPVRVRRYPEFDRANVNPLRCYTPEYVRAAAEGEE